MERRRQASRESVTSRFGTCDSDEETGFFNSGVKALVNHLNDRSIFYLLILYTGELSHDPLHEYVLVTRAALSYIRSYIVLLLLPRRRARARASHGRRHGALHLAGSRR